MRVVIDLTTGNIFLLHQSDTWRLDLSGGGIALVHVAERVIALPPT